MTKRRAVSLSQGYRPESRDFGPRRPRLLPSILWQDDARCGDSPEVDKQEFTSSFPRLDDARDLADRYCHQCPVVTECFNWAMDDTHFSGIAGGAMFSASKTRLGRRAVRRIPRKEEGDELS
jgi:hypothetical protein